MTPLYRLPLVLAYLVAFLVGIVCTNGARAGILMESVERNSKTGVERPLQAMRVQGGKARIDAGTDHRSAMIFKDDVMYVLDAQRKSYTAIDSATLERTMGAMNEMMTQMRAQLANMPPEQRAAMENMMKQNGMTMPGGASKPPVYEASATGAGEQAAGLACKVWNVKRDGALWQQLCVVPYASLPGRDEFQALAKKMRALAEKMGSAAQQFAGGPMQQDDALSAKLDGIPFITRRYRDGVLDGTETVVKNWRTLTVEASQFEIPAGYVKQELPTMPGAR